MGVHLNWIGLAISSGVSHNWFGSTITSPSGSAFPPYGSYNSMGTGYDYISSTQTIDGLYFYDKNADYVIRNDGAGGTYIDYSVAYNIVWKPVEVFHTSTDEPHNGRYVTTPCGTDWTQNSTGWIYTWNGSGGFTTEDNGYGTLRTGSGSSGYSLCQVPNTSYVFDGYYPNGKYDEYLASDMSPNYYDFLASQGSYYSYGTYITTDPSMGNSFYWDGNGGYYMV